MTNYSKLTVVSLFFICSCALLLSCGGKKSLSYESARELFNKGIDFYEREKYVNAIEAFQLIVYNHPGESIVDTAQYYLALSYFGNGEYQLARVEFNRLIINYPSSAYAVNAQFMQAVCFYEGTPTHFGLDQSDLGEAIKQFEDFIIDHPESELVNDAKKYLLSARTRMARKYYESGIVYVRINAFTAAKKYFQIVVDDYTDTEYAPWATYYIAESELNLGNYDEAARQLDNFILVFPEHEWVDKAIEKNAEAVFKSGEKAFEEGEYSLAREKFDSYIKKFPEPDNFQLRKAYFLSAEASFMEKEYQLALEKFQSYVDDFEKNRYTRKAENYIEEIEEILTRSTVNYVPDES
ncbi:MAG: outer membrane protein assembly factor BamD [candidate division Zixibacteria bacterium]|nr:outer membrane protein assembly factor BamD [candidate division Zixibacteria bacterium]